MQKLDYGFIVISILSGTACIILTHQKRTETLPQEVSVPAGTEAIVQQTYSRCPEALRTARPSPCDGYFQSFNECAVRQNTCEPHSVYEVLLNLISTPSDRGHENSPEPL
jgi:hypothetical protein